MVYGSRSLKRKRRTNEELDVVQQAIIAALKVDWPMTVRQVFYRLVSAFVIDKTELAYKGVVRQLGSMRLARTIPFNWIADSTRWMRKPRTDSSLELMLRRTCEAYRRSVWDNQDVYVEIWLEKDALAGVIDQVTSKWDVPLMVTRGYPSLSYLYSAAEAIEAKGKPAYLYYYGDHDPSGCDITRNVEERLREFAPTAEIHFQRMAVNPDQIKSMGLQTRPTKPTDTRNKNFKGESVEVDAIPPKELRSNVSGCITQHIDRHVYDELLATEKAERETLGGFIDLWAPKLKTSRGDREKEDREAEEAQREWLSEFEQIVETPGCPQGSVWRFNDQDHHGFYEYRVVHYQDDQGNPTHRDHARVAWEEYFDFNGKKVK